MNSPSFLPPHSSIIRLPSEDGSFYLIDRKTKTCTCLLFRQTSACKHLEAVGIYSRTKNPAKLSAKPNFYQALSGLVKGIRLRDIDEATHWLSYSWSFRERLNGAQFRIVRRLLIGSAEDGHSLAVMEQVSDNFLPLLSKDIEFARVVAELVRICKVPNWWMPDTGGHDYIYYGMLGSRKLLYDLSPFPLETCLQNLEKAILQQNMTDSLYWVTKAHACTGKAGSVIAHTLLDFALRYDNKPALRLMQNIYLRHAKALSNDTNFTSQAVWLLAGGECPVLDQIEIVTKDEVNALIERVNSAAPHIIPGWCCDGVHCAGNDIRYAGMCDRMYAVCNQYNYYNRMSPDDPWLEDKFYCLDGLQVANA